MYIRSSHVGALTSLVEQEAVYVTTVQMERRTYKLYFDLGSTPLHCRLPTTVFIYLTDLIF